MLKKMAKGDKPTKDKKKEGKQKKQEKNVQEPTNEEEEQDTELLDIQLEQNKQSQTKKVKRDNVKKNEFVMQEKQIDAGDFEMEKKEQTKKPLTSWVANSVAQVMKKDFKMEEHDHAFQSLTDKEFNEKHKEKNKKIEAQNVGKPVESHGMFLQPLQKSKDQLLLEKAENSDTTFTVNKNQPTTSLPITTNQKVFVNSNINDNFVKIEKTPQELRMEAMEKLEQQKAANPPPMTSWLGKKAQNPTTVVNSNPINFSKSPPMFTNSNTNSNINMMPLEKSEQQKKLQALEKNEPDMKFLSKKQMEERKKKREEKELLEKQEKEKQVK